MKAFFHAIAAHLPKVPRRGLILAAGLVWLAAGANIVRLGLPGFFSGGFSLPAWLGAAAVFAAFFLLIFGKLVQKHTARILAYEADRVMIFYFFDRRSYLLMAGMMALGILLRRSGLLPPLVLGAFYVGLGSALMGAGLGFLLRLRPAARRPAAEVPPQTGPEAEDTGHTP